MSGLASEMSLKNMQFLFYKFLRFFKVEDEKQTLYFISFKRVVKLFFIMAACFIAGILYNPLEKYWAKDTRSIAIRLEPYLHDDSSNQNRMNALINTLYILSFQINSKICYFINPTINKLPPGIWGKNIKYWKKGALIVLRENLLFLLEYPQLKKYKNIHYSYELIKVENLWSDPSADVQYIKAAYHLKEFKKSLIHNKKGLPSMCSDWLKYLNIVKRRLTILAEKLNDKIMVIERSKTPDSSYLNEVELLYEVQGSFWAIGYLMSGIGSTVVVDLNFQGLMADFSSLEMKLDEMDSENYSGLQQSREYTVKATAAMKKQRVNINYLLSLIDKLEGGFLCEFQGVRKISSN